VILGFVPLSSTASCPPGGGLCETIYFGPNGQVATAYGAGAHGDGLVTQTTATSVLYGTFAGSTCVMVGGQKSCGATQGVFPTLTTYGVVTRNGAGVPMATGVVGVRGALAGAAVGIAAAAIL
jgi:hypothetical protein